MSTEFPNKDRVVERIKKMLALARDAGASEGERDNAMRMAQATLTKYNLALAEIETHTGRKIRGEAVGRHEARFASTWVGRVLSAQAARLCFCDYIYLYDDSQKRSGAHQFIGRPANTVTAEHLARYLIDSVRREAFAAKRLIAPQQREHFVSSFCNGALQSIVTRITKLIEGEGIPAERNALVPLYRREHEETRQFLAQLLEQQNIRTQREPLVLRSSNGQAYRAGREYGDKVSLNRQVAGDESSAPRPALITENQP